MILRCLARGPAALLLLLALFAPGARAALLPLPIEQYFALRLFIPGCLTTGSYDVQTQVWTQSGSFDRCAPDPTVPGPGGTPVTIESFETRLVAQVDNDGNALGGLFTLSGAIPALGITEPSLLMSGSLIDAFYGPTVLSRSGVQPNALIELDFTLPVFGTAGDILLWQPFALIAGWSYPPAQFPNEMPWRTSVGEGGYRSYSNSQYLLYDRRVFFAPEPATLMLLGLGLASIGAGIGGSRRPPRNPHFRPARS